MSSKFQQKPFKIGSSPLELFYKKEILKNLVKFIRKHLCRTLLFNKITGSEVATWRCSVYFLKKGVIKNLGDLSWPATSEALAQVFSCEFCEFFKNTFFYRTPPVTTFADWNHATVLKRDSSTGVF